jgi:hypothetical protein
MLHVARRHDDADGAEGLAAQRAPVLHGKHLLETESVDANNDDRRRHAELGMQPPLRDAAASPSSERDGMLA